VKWEEEFLSVLRVDEKTMKEKVVVPDQELSYIGENVNGHNGSNSPHTVYIKEARLQDGNLEVCTVSSIVSNCIQRLLFSVLGAGEWCLVNA
jgi:hypothetical protein